MNASKCPVEECDLFDFMAHHVGMTVLHPGGLWATDRLAQLCHIGKRTIALDIACGKGTSAVYLVRKYGCRVSGIDIEESFVEQANKSALKKRLQHRMEFRTGDALHLPYPENEFDATFSQAFLILIPDKSQAIHEAIRVTKPGGYIGWLELSFTQQPPHTLFQAAAAGACVLCIRNALTFSDWETFFRENGLTDLEVIKGEMGTRQRRMFRDEGMVNAARIMQKWLLDTRVRRRMNAVFDFFRDNQEYIGYGIYVGKKPPAG
jgi:SAM-dependent methyltransferase